jgi:hypothetical protein
VVSVAFTNDDHYVAAVVNGPDSRVLIFKRLIQKSGSGKTVELVAQREFPKQDIGKVSFHPMDKKILVLSGKGILQQWSIQEGELVPSEFVYQGSGMPPLAELSFTDHAWTEDNLLIASTRFGEVFIFQLFNLQQTL